MSPEGAIAWLNVMKESMDKNSERSKIIAIEMGIEAIKKVRNIERENKKLESASDIVGESFLEMEQEK